MTETTRKYPKRPDIMKRTIKDSVFTSLFQDKKYLLQLYRALHPEDDSVTENSLTDITIKNVLTDNIYNDLGFTVGERLMILAEAQSTWTINIIVRALMYLAWTYRNYFERTRQNLYGSRKVQMPVPEIYVIYTGNRKEKPPEISLAKEFFNGQKSCLDVRVKVVYNGKKGDIINQYIAFTKICGRQVKLHGRSRKAVLETIRICKDRNVLKEYLSEKEEEVVDIMMVLYDEEEIMRSYWESVVYETTQEVTEAVTKSVTQAVTQDERMKTAKRMLEDGTFPLDKIARFSNLPIETVQRLADAR